ncbi:MAG: hypothetical protein EP330_26440 [Deltaproteobacteria bacterium]|nr:MAG: hypothetical protein EP330_26440 [Deltaproteobacteria bacterium]
MRSLLWLLPALMLPGCPRATGPEPTPAAAVEDVEVDEPEGDTLSPEAAREDAQVLYDTLRSAHFDLFAHVDEAAHDAAYEAMLARLDQPMTRVALARELMAFAALGRFGHSQVVFPVDDYVTHVVQGGTVLPFDLRPDGERVWVAHSQDPAVPVGAELVSLDGRPAGEWVVELGRYIAAESPRFRDAVHETMFPRLLWLHGAGAPTHSVVLRVDGESRTLEVAEQPAIEVEPNKSEWETRGFVRQAEVLPGGIGYLRPGPFSAMEGETLEDVVRFVDVAFAAFVEAEARVVILDLRDNAGGDNSFSDPMLAWVADEPFGFASEYRLKASPRTREVLAGLAEGEPDGVSAAMLAAMGEHEDGDTFAFPLPLAEPRADGFDGEVWALVHRHSYSNATVVAAQVQDYGMGKVAGEETVDLPSSFASSAQFTLPNSGFTVVYPKGWFARPSGEVDDRGVVPDLPLAPAPPGAEGDPMLDALLAHLRGE